MQGEAGRLQGSTVIQRRQTRLLNAQTFGRETGVRRGHYHRQPRVCPQQRHEGLGVQMVGVIMTGGHHVDEVQPLRSYDPPGHADVRFVGRGVLLRQRVGEVGVQQQVAPLPCQQEPALPEPPDARAGTCCANVREKGVVLECRTDHPRTCRTPFSMLASFCFAAQRAVWLNPQSGAKESRSGGA